MFADKVGKRSEGIEILEEWINDTNIKSFFKADIFILIHSSKNLTLD